MTVEYKGFILHWSGWRTNNSNDVEIAFWVGYRPGISFGVHAVVPFGGVGEHNLRETFDISSKKSHFFSPVDNFVTMHTPVEVRETWKHLGLGAVQRVIDRIETEGSRFEKPDINPKGLANSYKIGMEKSLSNAAQPPQIIAPPYQYDSVESKGLCITKK